MTIFFSRRRLLQNSLIAAGGGVLAACGSNQTPPSTQPIKMQTTTPSVRRFSTQSSNQFNTMRIFASSGFCEDATRIPIGVERLSQAGFVLSNVQAAYRRSQRFAGNDAERAADFQDVATGRVAVPKMFMGARGGYGAIRILPHVDWARLGARMKEHGTLLLGFSDVTAVQLALLAQSMMPSFAGPMLYSEFGKPELNIYTMDSFIRTTTAPQITISASGLSYHQPRAVDGILWGGNLSVLASLVGTPYMPKISGGILFLEDVSEQPYRIERMLHTLHLAGILKQQQVIVLGDFRMGNIRDTYDASYDLNAVAQNISRVTGVPVLMNFPFGHIANKTTFPLGAHASLRPTTMGGYQITFSDYPTLDANRVNLGALLPPPTFDFIQSDVSGSEITE